MKQYRAMRPNAKVMTMLVTKPCATFKWDKPQPRSITLRKDSTGIEMGVLLRIKLISGSKEMIGKTAPLENS